MNQKNVNKFIKGIGMCAKCCDTQGPWTWHKGRWLCDSCLQREEEYEKTNCEEQSHDERRGAGQDSKEDAQAVE